MNRYHNMSETEKRDFQKVVAVCTAGAALILILPLLFRLFL